MNWNLIGTIVHMGTAWAVYAQPPLSLKEFWEKDELFYTEFLSVGPEFRLVMVTDDPAPETLPPDLSASIN